MSRTIDEQAERDVTTTSPHKLAGDMPAFVQLTIKKSTGHEEHFFVCQSTPLREPMEEYCNRRGLRFCEVCCMAEEAPLSPNDTVDALGFPAAGVIDLAPTGVAAYLQITSDAFHRQLLAQPERAIQPAF